MHELFMSNVAAAAVVQGCKLLEPSDVMEIQQGDQVNLHSDAGTFQVIGVDGEHDRHEGHEDLDMCEDAGAGKEILI